MDHRRAGAAAALLASALLLCPRAGGATTVGGTIATDTTWTKASSPYDVTSDVTVAAGVTLIIEAGTVVRFEQHVSLIVNGILHADGSSTDPVTFSGVVQSPGGWTAIAFAGTEATPISGSTLDHVVIEDSGWLDASVTATYASFAVTGSTIRDGNGDGIHCGTGGAADVSDTTFTGNRGYAVRLDDGGASAAFSGLSASGNGNDAVGLGTGQLTGARTWAPAGIPLDVLGNLTVPEGSLLTLSPGLTVRFGYTTGLHVLGTIRAAGTADQPILLTALNGMRGGWAGLTIEGRAEAPSFDSTLDHVTVEYGGWTGAGVTLKQATLDITSSTVRESSADGVQGMAGSTMNASDTTFSGNQGYAVELDDGSQDPVLSNLTFTGNVHDGVAIGAGTISGSAHWEATAGTYYLLGNVTIAGSLQIDPGLQVQASPTVLLTCKGPITARGTASLPIRFAAANGLSGGWSGIALSGTSQQPNTGSDLENVTVENAGWIKAAISLDHAQLTLARSTVKGSNLDGLWAGVGSGLDARGDSFEGNKGYAIVIDDASVDPSLGTLTFSGNGHDGVSVGAGTTSGAQLWERTAGTYFVRGTVTVGEAASLDIESGVTVAMGQDLALKVAGTLLAGGTAAAPITFTAANGMSGGWDAVVIAGSKTAGALQNTGSLLEHVIIEKGGWNGAELVLDHARATITDAVIRQTSTDGVAAIDAVGTYLGTAQITDISGTHYALRNDTPAASTKDPYGGSVVATHAWWGDASGPLDTACNPTGGGGRITSGVEYAPFLTAADATAGPAAPPDSLSIELSPQRWYAPADGATQVYVKLTVREGNGLPAPGRTLRLASTLGQVKDGAMTDVSGETFALLTSSQPGDAQLSASVDQPASCGTVRSGTSKVTFQAAADDPNLATDAPYFSGDIQLLPQPLTQGTPSVVRATFHNPAKEAVDIDASFAIAQIGIGLVFGPIGNTTITIPPGGSQVAEVPWTPQVSGHQCVNLQYTVTAHGGLAGPDPGAQHNDNAQQGSMCSLGEQNALDKARQATNVGSKAGSAATKGLGIQWALFGYMLSFDFNTAEGSIKALQGDPPVLDYKRFPTVQTYDFTPAVADATLPQAVAEAENTLLRSTFEVRGLMQATQDALDRYGGASAARDVTWASQQVAAYRTYKHKMALAMGPFADAMDAYVAAVRQANIDLSVSSDAATAYIAGLESAGWDDGAKQAGQILHLSDADLDSIRQATLAAGADALVGDPLPVWSDVATAFRALGDAILAPPETFQPSGGISIGGSAGLGSDTAPAPANLVRLHTSRTTFQVGNPLASRATIGLGARPVDLPSDFSVSISPVSVTLDPGQQATVTVTIQPGAPVPWDSQPRVAVEAASSGKLIGGLVVSLMTPHFVPAPDTCDEKANLAEGATCTCPLACGQGMMCAPSGNASQCLVACDTSAVSCPHAGQTCKALEAGSTAGVCTPPGGKEPAAPAAKKKSGCGCSHGGAEALALIVLVPLLLPRTRPRRPR